MDDLHRTPDAVPPLPCMEDETDFIEPRYYEVDGQPVVRRDKDAEPIGFLPGGTEEPVAYGIWAYTGRRISLVEFEAMRSAQDAGLTPAPAPAPPPLSLMPPPSSIGFIEGPVTAILSRGFVMENQWGDPVRVATQVSGRQTGLRAGDRVRVSGGSDAKGVFLSAWATKTGQDGSAVDVPVNRDDLRRRPESGGGAVPWWQFWRVSE